ncbi:palmitoyltransferase ZDHHC14-like isoform X2 [Convolutriloba macropyga]|uniref:palmitoyltransferase ZDHHC14-like isoform X2 n=1 Tax=Convolutriloba macropyga TaxID=536237 RepID=UPI003F51F4F5
METFCWRKCYQATKLICAACAIKIMSNESFIEYQGNNTICCKGRLIGGKDVPTVIGGLIYVAALITLSCVAEVAFLLENFSPIVVVVPLGLLFYGLVNFVLTSTSDPGIIPRSTYDEVMYMEKELVKKEGASTSAETKKYQEYESKKVLIRGIEVEVKWCDTCKLWRPPRASHCSRCNNCIESFDHHCPYMGNCIGKRNYRYFFMYLLSMTTLLLYALVFSAYHLIHTFITEDQLISAEAILTAVNCMALTVNVLGVSVFLIQHCYLTVYALTTYEESKGVWTPGSNTKTSASPYTAKRGGCLANCANTLCGPRHPKRLRVEQRKSEDRKIWIDVSNKPVNNDSLYISRQNWTPSAHNCVAPSPEV